MGKKKIMKKIIEIEEQKRMKRKTGILLISRRSRRD